MDYFKQRRAYRNLKMCEVSVSNGQNNLYRELLDYANDESKLDGYFRLKNSALASLTGLSEAGIKIARNKLVQMGLIKYRAGKKNVLAPEYQIVQLYTENKSMATSWATSTQKSSSTSIKRVAQPVTQPVAQPVAHKNLTNTDYDKTNKKKSKKNPVPVRHEYGEYKNVMLTDADFEKLKTEFPKDWQERLNNLSEYMESSGKHYKNHLATIRNWARRDSKTNGTARYSGRKNIKETLPDWAKPGYKQPKKELTPEEQTKQEKQRAEINEQLARIKAMSKQTE